MTSERFPLRPTDLRVPQTVEEARAALAVAEVHHRDVARALRRRDPQDFESVDAYLAWKARATVGLHLWEKAVVDLRYALLRLELGHSPLAEELDATRATYASFQRQVEAMSRRPTTRDEVVRALADEKVEVLTRELRAANRAAARVEHSAKVQRLERELDELRAMVLDMLVDESRASAISAAARELFRHCARGLSQSAVRAWAEGRPAFWERLVRATERRA